MVDSWPQRTRFRRVEDQVDLEDLRLPDCDIEGCDNLALGGKCNWRALCFTGCGKRLCLEHQKRTGATGEMTRSAGVMEMYCDGC